MRSRSIEAERAGLFVERRGIVITPIERRCGTPFEVELPTPLESLRMGEREMACLGLAMGLGLPCTDPAQVIAFALSSRHDSKLAPQLLNRPRERSRIKVSEPVVGTW